MHHLHDFHLSVTTTTQSHLFASSHSLILPIGNDNAMIGLRRRLGRDPPAEESSNGNSTPESEDLTLVPSKHLHGLKEENRRVKGTKRRNAWIFALGGLFGLLLAGFLASNNDLIDIASLADIHLDQLMDVLPAGLINEAKEFQVWPY
jgi:phospholipid:diacylglycerol acyltransferase